MQFTHINKGLVIATIFYGYKILKRDERKKRYDGEM